MSNKKSLQKAFTAKNDEFYTQLSDIENELKHYQKYFEGKTVFCNCDDPRISNFFKYFSLNFEKLKLKKLITTCYKSQKVDSFSQHDSDNGLKLEYDGDTNKNPVPDNDEINIVNLESDGDFRSQECIEILKQSDIVCTNPPFSLFKEYMAQLIEYKKKFVIVGNQNAISYVEIFKMLKENKIWLGTKAGNMTFQIPDYYQSKNISYDVDEQGQKWKSLGNICWFTNLDIYKRHEKLICVKKYDSKLYPTFDNYDAINVNKLNDIPIDYKGKIGVPITIMTKYNPDQFEIIDAIGRYSLLEGATKKTKGKYLTEINKKRVYARVIVKHKRNIK